MENKKIRGATKTSYNGIQFKSQLEKTIFVTLQELGFNPEYEPITFTIWKGFQPITPFYDKETDKQRLKRIEGGDKNSSRLLKLKDKSIIDIKYTPDFHFIYKNVHVYIEAKGMENDLFYIKKKMFIKLLDGLFKEEGIRSIYFEIYTKRQLLQAIEIIKNYGETKES